MTSHRWKRFFVDSGLPAEICDNYAVIFTENRIRFDMLDELNKEILYDMGIKKMGDVISILRHAKEVHSNSYREKLFADDCKEDSQSFIKADSTISNENLKKNTLPVSKRVVLPKKEKILIDSPKPIVKNNIFSSNSRMTPKSEPVIIRNITGLNNSISVNKKRIQPPSDDITCPKQLKTESSDPVVRRRINEQTRFLNFSKVIHNAITSNAPKSNIVSANVQQTSIKNRLSLNEPDTTKITINRTPIAKKDVKSRLGVNVKDRLGDKKKSVFERISTTNKPNLNSNSVFNRLGAK